MSKLGKRLIASAKEALDIAQGTVETARSVRVSVDDPDLESVLRKIFLDRRVVLISEMKYRIVSVIAPSRMQIKRGNNVTDFLMEPINAPRP